MFLQRPKSPLSISEEEKSPVKSRHERDLPITKLDQNLRHISGLNIPRTDFLKALNFERFSARSCLQNGDRSGHQVSDTRASVDYSEAQNGNHSTGGADYNGSHGAQYGVDVDGNEHEDSYELVDAGSENDCNEGSESGYNENVLNDSDAENIAPDGEGDQDGMDELDQAEVLRRFKQLRDLQWQEQQKLVLEQQRQLDKLREEQQKVQDMLMCQQIAALSPQKASRVRLLNESLSGNPSSGQVKVLKEKFDLSKSSGLDYNHNRMMDHSTGVGSGDAVPLFHGDVSADDDAGEYGEEEDEEELDGDDCSSNGDETEEDVEHEEEEEEDDDQGDQQDDTEDDAEKEDYDEDAEDIDEDYLQCSIVENEADQHVNHVEDLLRHSRDLFGHKDHKDSAQNDFDTVLSKKPAQIKKTPQNQNVRFDEKPVGGSGKTFEQLLEEELKREKSTNQTLSTAVMSSTTPSSGVAKRPFLKRGQGTARFGHSPAPLKPTSTPKPKSQQQKVKSPQKMSLRDLNEVVLKLQKPAQNSNNKSPIKHSVLVSNRSSSPSKKSSNSSLKRSRIDDVDLEELEEFELLEKYADDYSFTSNCSIINPRPMKMKKQVINFVDVWEEKAGDEEDEVFELARDGLSRRDCERDEDAVSGQCDSALTRSSPAKAGPALGEMSCESPCTPRRLKRKIASRTGETTTVEKEVLVEDHSPLYNESVDDNVEVGSEFDDEETWTTSIPKPNFSRTTREKVDTTSDTPPTSKLVARLFPSLNAQSKPQPEPTKVSTNKNDQGVMSKALKDKLSELEQEIERFRSENAVLAKIKKERLNGLEELKKEVEAFEEKKNKELEEIERLKDEEMKKLKNERKLFEKYQKEMRAIPDKNQRREIEELKAEIQELKDELKQKETRWSSSTNRLRNRIESLEKENAELQDELKLMEKERLEQWQKELAARNNERKKKTQSVPPQQKIVLKEELLPKEESAENVPEILRAQFDKLLRASLDDVAKELQPRITPEEPRVNSIPTSMAAQNQNGNGVLQNMSSDKAKSSQVRKSDFKVDFGNGKYREIRHKDGKVEREYVNGSKEVLFANGTRKQISADSQSVIVSFFNGDIKQILPDQRVVYYYADSQTQHTTFPDGIELLEFPNHQVEKQYPNGTREILFPDHTIKYLYPGGAEESVFADGTIVKVDRNGDRVMSFPNGQREIHTKLCKKREYPDGTTKTVYPDGRQETRYSSGRVRVKDAQGNVLVDKMA